LDGLAGDLGPGGYALLQRVDRDQALHSHLLVVAAPREVVVDRYLVPEGTEVESGGPPEVSVTAKNQDLHIAAPMPDVRLRDLQRSRPMRRRVGGPSSRQFMAR